MRAKTEAISGVTIDALLRRRRPRVRGSTFCWPTGKADRWRLSKRNEPATPRLSGVDEIGYSLGHPEWAKLFFQLVNARYGRRAGREAARHHRASG